MWAISSSKSCNGDSLSKFGSKWFRCDTIRICFRRKGDRQVETLKLFQVFHVKMQTSLITEIFLGTATQILCQPISHAASAKLLQQAILCTTFILNTAWDYKCLSFMLPNPVQKWQSCAGNTKPGREWASHFHVPGAQHKHNLPVSGLLQWTCRISSQYDKNQLKNHKILNQCNFSYNSWNKWCSSTP